MQKRTLFTAAALLALPLAAAPLLLRAQDAPAPLTTAPTAAPPAVAPTAPSVPLRYKWVAGQVRRYKMTMTTNGTIPTGTSGTTLPMNMAMQMVMRQTVKDVNPTDGVATIVSQIGSMRMAMNGQEMPMTAAQLAPMRKPMTMQMLPSGKMMSLETPGLAGAGVPGMDIGKSLMSSTLAFPDGPVKVGDTWNGALGAGMMGMQMAMASTLAGVETKDGAQIATISQKITGNLSAMTKAMPAGMGMSGNITGTGTMLFDTTAGALVSQSLQNVIDMTVIAKPGAPAGVPPSMNIKMKQTTLMERLPDAAAGQ